MHTPLHNKTNYCNKFDHCVTLKNFQKWTQIAKKTLHGKGRTSTSRAELGQTRMALTAFVNALCEIHSESRVKTNENSSCSRSAHNSLFIALRFCFEFGIESKNTVNKLLQEIFCCDGNLHSIFSVLSLCHVTHHFASVNIDSFFLYPGASSENFEQTVFPAFKYYLECLYNGKESKTFRISSILKNAIDENNPITPLMAATIRKDQQLVKLLLGHGSDPLHLLGVMGAEGEILKPSPLSYIISSLNSYCALIKSPNFDNKFFETSLECFNLMAKVAANVQINVSSPQWNQDDHNKETLSNVFTINSSLSHFINLEDFKGPSSLKKSCKISVRNVVSCKGELLLEEAIKCLPIPQVVQGFLVE